MEVIIPPRDHGPSTFRYTWDENGDVQQIQRHGHLSPFDPPHAETNTGFGPPNRVNGSVDYTPSDRQKSVQWPFQHSSTPSGSSAARIRAPGATYYPGPGGGSSPSTTLASTPTVQRHQPHIVDINDLSYFHLPPRRATWQPTGLVRDDDSSVSDASSDLKATVDKDLIPDYVINYLRGETPESLARKKYRQTHHAAFAGSEGARGGRSDGSPEPRPRAAGGRGAGAGAGPGHRHYYSSGDHDSSSSSGTSSTSRERMLPPMPEEGGGGEKGGNGGATHGGGWRRQLTGWRGGVLLICIVTSLVLVVGFVCLILAVSKTRMLGGESTVYAGSCANTARVEWGIRTVANIAAIVMLAGANYVFQVLTSPTRAEVSAAHDSRRWLDIGIPSIRNLRSIAASRVALACAVLLAALVGGVMYNSFLYTTTEAVASYEGVFVTPAFLLGAPFSNASETNRDGLSRLQILSLQDAAARPGQLVNLTSARECLDVFGGPYTVGFDAFVAVTDFSSDANSLVQTLGDGHLLSGYLDPNSPPDQLYLDPFITGLPTTGPAGDLIIPPVSVSYCLARPTASPPQCSVRLSSSFLGICILLNLVLVLLAAAVLSLLSRTEFVPLATLGDALASFLADPDPTTRGTCLLTKHDVWAGRWGGGASSAGGSAPSSSYNSAGHFEPKFYVPPGHTQRWMHAPSIPRWLLAITTWLVPVALTSAALAVTLHSSDVTRHFSPFAQTTSPRAVLFTVPGKGRPGDEDVPSTLPDDPILRTPTTPPAPALALLSALPHLLLAALYLVANSHLTVYAFADELSLFALGHHRVLRLSAAPSRSRKDGHLHGGAANTSLYLTLPRPYSWVLVLLFAVLGTILRGCLVVVAVDNTGASATSTASTSPALLTGLAFSTTGLLVLLLLLVLLAALVLGLGFRRIPPSRLLTDGQDLDDTTMHSTARTTAGYLNISHLDPHHLHSARMRRRTYSANPLFPAAGTCSAVLSARCHRVAGEWDVGAPGKALAWGVVGSGRGRRRDGVGGAATGLPQGWEGDANIGHCTFTGRRAAPIDLARAYA